MSADTMAVATPAPAAAGLLRRAGVIERLARDRVALVARPLPPL